MKTKIIEIPDGFEIDETKTKIVFTEILKKLPRAFKELERISGFYVDNTSSVDRQNDDYAIICNPTIIPSISKLTKLR